MREEGKENRNKEKKNRDGDPDLCPLPKYSFTSISVITVTSFMRPFVQLFYRRMHIYTASGFREKKAVL